MIFIGTRLANILKNMKTDKQTGEIRNSFEIANNETNNMKEIQI